MAEWVYRVRSSKDGGWNIPPSLPLSYPLITFLQSLHFTLAILHHLSSTLFFRSSPFITSYRPMFITTLLNRRYIFLSEQHTEKQHNHIGAFLKQTSNPGPPAHGAWGWQLPGHQANPQDAASVGPRMEITQITIPVCQVRLHLHVFQARKDEWPAKSGHWDKGRLGF